MSQIVENRADVTGVIEDVQHEDDATRIRLTVVASESVDGFPNLLQEDVGSTITVRVPGRAAGHGPGDTIRCRVRRAGPDRYYAEWVSG